MEHLHGTITSRTEGRLRIRSGSLKLVDGAELFEELLKQVRGC